MNSDESDESPPGPRDPVSFAIAGARELRILRPREVGRRTTLSVAQINRLQRENRFPRYMPWDGRTVAMLEHVLDAFFARRMEARADLPPYGFRPPLPKWQFDIDDVPAICGIHLLRMAEVENLVGIKRTQIYRRIPEGTFPPPVSLGAHAARWVAHEIREYLREHCPPAMALSRADGSRSTGDPPGVRGTVQCQPSRPDAGVGSS